jgi:glyoxylase-like metal-dependent hydrolase (beta-lactamase superfamily II)/rhodanese-related sulfurtransferase
MIEIHVLDTPSLGDRSYLVTDGEVAVAIDPQRDIDRMLDLARTNGVVITHVAETHIHNDYVTGGFALARRLGAEYLVSADDDVAFARRPVRDGDVVTTGHLRLRVLHTPGHTFTHLSYVLEDVDERVHGVFTGGSLLFGSTGRPDLLGAQHTKTLARHQHASAHRLAATLPGTTPLFPTHGFGSFCSATPTRGSSSTVAEECRHNPALTQDEDAFVAGLLAGLSAYPSYYLHMAPLNAAGPGPVVPTLPERVDPADLRRRIRDGEWVVDLRRRAAYAAGHLPGSLNFGIDGSFLTYLGWLIPWGTPVSLVADSPSDALTAVRELCRIGIDRAEAMAVGDPLRWGGGAISAFQRVTFAELGQVRAAGHRPVVLDVRRAEERRTAAIAGTRFIPLHELPRRLPELPSDRTVWVHCAAGYRASIAAGLVEATGRHVVLIDDRFPSGGVPPAASTSPAAAFIALPSRRRPLPRTTSGT